MKELETLKKAALAGGRVLAAKFGKVTYRLKGRANLLTEADLASQETVIATIKKSFPHDAIIAEECEAQNINNKCEAQTCEAQYINNKCEAQYINNKCEAQYINNKCEAQNVNNRRLAEKTPGGRLWIIDPLDGTTNYAHGFPAAAVSIGFSDNGIITAGGVYDPFRKELFLAGRGRGAFVNGGRLAVSRTPSVSKALLVTGFPYDRAGKTEFYCGFFSEFLKLSHDVRRMGAASLDLCWLAAGRTDGYWEFGLKPWDVAAGKLILEEAGGKVTDFSGRPWKTLDCMGSQTLASNGRVHAGMLRVIKKRLAGGKR